MGVGFYLCNHRNATYFELGKGPFGNLKGGIFRHENECREFLTESFANTWKLDTEEEKKDFVDYCNLLARELATFVGDSDSLEVVNDCVNDWSALRALKYKCTGSRYALGEEVNAKYIEHENGIVRDFSDLSDFDVEDLSRRGWNFKNVVRNKKTRYDILKLAKKGL